MNKTGLIRLVWDLMNVAGAEATQSQATEVTEGLLKTLGLALANRQEISIAGFGKLYTITRKATRKNHPRNPSVILEVPERDVIRFKAFEALQKNTNTH
jgi:nucleoid DNA-binding protein